MIIKVKTLVFCENLMSTETFTSDFNKFFHTNLLLCQTTSPTLHGSIIFKNIFRKLIKNVT